ncbi:MAG: chordopoxvirus fusion protein, partial [Thermoanaerobaculia bacterium]
MSTLEIYEKLRKVLDEKIAIEIAEAIEKGLEYYEKMVTKEEFGELKEAVLRLTKAQEKTEEKLNELAEAQKRTEERLGKLEEKMAELAEAQKRTEERLTKLEE